MQACKYYANGYCKFGDDCRFNHDPHKPNRQLYSKTYNQSQNHDRIINNHSQFQNHHGPPPRQTPNPSSSFSFAKTFNQLTSSASTSIFGGSAGSAAAPSQSKFTSFFSRVPNSNTSTQPSIFGNTTHSLPKQSQPSFFAPSKPTSAFPSFFGGSKSQQPPASNLAINTSQSGSSANAKSKAYTPLDQLTDEDKQLFQQAHFNGLIPLQPPPPELCF